MDRETLLKNLRELHGYDKETDHMLADSWLLEFIGDKEITQVFDDVKKWYA